MHPVNFKGSIDIRKPEDMTDEQCMSIWAKFGFDRLFKVFQSKGIMQIPPGMYAGVDVVRKQISYSPKTVSDDIRMRIVRQYRSMRIGQIKQGHG